MTNNIMLVASYSGIIKSSNYFVFTETFNYTVRFPETVVPAKETTYICITFEFPIDQEYHLVAYDPYIDNRDVMHHTLVFGCEGGNKLLRNCSNK